MKQGIYCWHFESRPNEYCIGEWDNSKRNYETRIKEELGKIGVNTEKYIIDFAEEFDFNVNKAKGFDKEVHSLLISFFGQSVQLRYNNRKSEWFELPKKYKNPVKIFHRAVECSADPKQTFDPDRPDSYSPRKGSQDEAIKAVKSAKTKGCKKFLLGCKCRFGKTFTSYEIAKELNYGNILIMTFRPSDTKEAWLSDLNSHQHFKEYQFFNQNEIKAYSEFTGKKVLFISFQKAKVSAEFEEVKKLDFDMIIIDEDHIGAHRVENRDLLNELNKDFTLVLTGTPELELISDEFGSNDFYKFDYVDEQELKEQPDTAAYYADMPKLELYSFDLSQKFAHTIQDLHGFALSEFFHVATEKFVYAPYVNKVLDYISMQNDDASSLPDVGLGIFANPDFDMSHGLWKLPSIKACKLLKELLNKHKFFKDFEVEVLPESDKSPKQIEKVCKEKSRTIWLTVMKNTVGVTVKNWTYTISLYGSDSSSLSSYIQFIFRAGSPGKEVFRTFDFCPSRVLDVVDGFATARCSNTNNVNYQAVISKVLNYLPVFAYNNAGGFNELTPNELFKQIATFRTTRSCRNLLYKEFELFEEYADDVADIDIDMNNPTISKNEALKKLKKELQKKEKNSKKEKSEKDENKDFVEKMFQAFIDIYRWVKYDKGVDDIDEFIKKLESYKDNYESWFGFSDEFMNAFIAVMKSSKKKFGIAIERFKMIEFKFAMEDVPKELALKMIAKMDLKSGQSVCDFYCKGPTLLKMLPDYVVKYAYVRNNDLKAIRILEKEVDNVNIIKETTMHFDHIIMNPPYDGNLHLKILQEAMKHSDDVVNLSPIRWLQDPLAEYKKRSDWFRFEDIREKIEDIEIISAKDANKLFGIVAFIDLGIYSVTPEGGRDLANFWKEVRKPAEVMMIEKLIAMKDNLLNHIEKQKLDGIRVPLTDIGGNRGYKPVYKELAYVVDGKKDGKDWTKCKNMGGYEKPEGSALPLSVKFASAAEAKNFYDVFYTKFGSWLCDITHTQQNLQTSILPWLSDYTHPWTDEMLYKFFGLTPEEIKEIENAF